MFYERFAALCEARGVSPSRAAQEAGLSKALVSKWKNEPDIQPTGNVIGKLTQYFGVSVADLLGEEAALASESSQQSFYQTLVRLSRRKGVSPSRAAVDAGLSKSTVTKWKNDPTCQPNGVVLAKLAEYFQVNVSELLGESMPLPETVSDDAIKFALFGGSDDITDAMYQEVRSFAAFVREREAAKRRKE